MGAPRKMHDSDILQFMRSHDDPVLTASEIAAEFGVTNAAVNKRLNMLHEEGEVVKKKVGGSAVVWWVTHSGPANTWSTPDSVSQ